MHFITESVQIRVVSVEQNNIGFVLKLSLFVMGKVLCSINYSTVPQYLLCVPAF